MRINLEYILKKSLLWQTRFLSVFLAQRGIMIPRDLHPPPPCLRVQRALIHSKRWRRGGWVVQGGLTGDEMGLPELLLESRQLPRLEQQQEDSVGTLWDFPERPAIFATLEISAVRV